MHKRVHTGDRPLRCEFPGCGKRFSESSNLSKHRKSEYFLFLLFSLYLGGDEIEMQSSMTARESTNTDVAIAHLSVGQHRCRYPGCIRTFHRLGMFIQFSSCYFGPFSIASRSVVASCGKGAKISRNGNKSRCWPLRYNQNFFFELEVWVLAV